jgi:glycerophosphoryl diester phosphodiesterase
MKKLFFTIASLCMLQQMKAQDTKIIAHRGAWKEFNLPENSIASLQKAIEIKAFGSEFDVRRTLDGKLVVNHDPTHFGDTIELTNYAVLNAKKLSNGEDLPLLEDYFKKGTASDHQTLLICEIKAALLSNTTSQLTTLETLELAKKLGIEDRIIYISFDFEVLQTIRTNRPKAIVLYLENNKSLEEVMAAKFNGINFNYAQFIGNPSLAANGKKQNLMLGSWTVNKDEDFNTLVAQGITFITTNFPERYLTQLDHKH